MKTADEEVEIHEYPDSFTFEAVNKLNVIRAALMAFIYLIKMYQNRTFLYRK